MSNNHLMLPVRCPVCGYSDCSFMTHNCDGGFYVAFQNYKVKDNGKERVPCQVVVYYMEGTCPLSLRAVTQAFEESGCVVDAIKEEELPF